MTDSVKEVWEMACPKCGADDQIDISATVWVRLCPDGTDITAAENGDYEWNKDTAAVCHNCGHSGTISDFENTDEVRISNNERRAQRAADALYGYVKAKGEVYEESSSEVVDLITDLLHFVVKLDQGDDPIESALRLARLHFEAETEGDSE